MPRRRWNGRAPAGNIARRREAICAVALRWLGPGGALNLSLSATGGVNCGFERPIQLCPASQDLPLALEMEGLSS